ncbi:MAG: molybdopterin molybdotransferase MoeA, partial [Romboutsia sp.]|uniref:molybdopterin molybdotransferase MoeA n=1 Tax=Romboutsia sp. TaxID=1965302 RepID=UPI003F3CEBB1
NLNTKKNKIEKVSLLKGAQRIVAKDIYSEINNPPFNKSAMDGYAVKVDLEGNKYKVIDTIYAGETFKDCINNNEAVKIMTGVKIPDGANGVVKKEDVILDGEYIIIPKNIKENENICFLGEDISKSQVLAKKGKKLNFADIGILASCGVGEVEVYEDTKIGFLTTGDELIDIDQNLIDGKIYNSNKYSILARLGELNYSCEVIDHAKDEIVQLADKIKILSQYTDLIITTGGASVGDKDLLEDAINYLKGEHLFKKINIKPGSSVLASKYNNTIIISLSGNPNAALTTFELLVKPTLERLSGIDDNSIKRESAILSVDYNKGSNVRRFLRGKVFTKDSRQYVSITQIKSGNGILSSIIDSNCLIEIDKGSTSLKEGNKVNIIKL